MSNTNPSSLANIDYELLSHIAHEARGPYNGLIGFSDLLDSHFDSLPVERQKEYAHYVKLLASKSFFQLQTFIAWLKLVSNNFKINHSTFYLSEAVKLAVQYNANDIKGKMVSIDSPADELGQINGDINYISIALAHVISFSLHGIEKHSNIAVNIVALAKKGFSVNISFKSTEPEELVHLLNQTGTAPDQVPESKTGLWVSAQILKHHRSTMSVEVLPENRIDIDILFRLQP